MSKNDNESGISRRNFIKGLGGGIVGTATITSAISGCSSSQVGPHGSKIRGPEKTKISLKINGKKHSLEIEPRISLLDVIRGQVGLTGAKRVCDRGECGACTVIMNGKTVLACSILALDADGAEIETVEGLAKRNKLHPVQKAFVKHDAFQCGFCTSGFIMSSVALLRKNPNPKMDEIKQGVAGNLCRCGAYPNIFKAVSTAAETMKKGG